MSGDFRGRPAFPLPTGTPLLLTFVRTGGQVTFGVGPVGSTPTTRMLATSASTDGTTAYGAGAVYPAISLT